MDSCRRVCFVTFLLIGIWLSHCMSFAQQKELDVEFVATPPELVMEMLRVAAVNKDDIVYDLGCGDGRIVIAAAKEFGARGVGVDIDPLRIQESRENAQKAGVANRIAFLEQDLFITDIREATVVALYLLPELNMKLRPIFFQQLKPGTRIVSHAFDMGDWKPDRAGQVKNVAIFYPDGGVHRGDAKYFFWVLPANIHGRWGWTIAASSGERRYTVEFRQKYQEIGGKVETGGQETALTEASLNGDRVQFHVRSQIGNQAVGMRFAGQVKEKVIQGSVEITGGTFAGTHPWVASRIP